MFLLCSVLLLGGADERMNWADEGMNCVSAAGGEAAGGSCGVSDLPRGSCEERSAQLHLQTGERVREADLVRPSTSSSDLLLSFS